MLQALIRKPLVPSTVQLLPRHLCGVHGKERSSCAYSADNGDRCLAEAPMRLHCLAPSGRLLFSS